MSSSRIRFGSVCACDCRAPTAAARRTSAARKSPATAPRSRGVRGSAVAANRPSPALASVRVVECLEGGDEGVGGVLGVVGVGGLVRVEEQLPPHPHVVRPDPCQPCSRCLASANGNRSTCSRKN